MSDLPRIFHSVRSEDVFRTCDLCACDLTEPGRRHIVLKAFHTRRGGPPEPITEFALCTRCLENDFPQPSDESLEAIIAFRAEKTDRTAVFRLPPADGIPSGCELCGRTVDDCRTFTARADVVAEDDGSLRLARRPSLPWFPGSPAMVCDDCNGQIAERLSKQTRDDWDRFYDAISDPDPSIELDDAPQPLFV